MSKLLLALLLPLLLLVNNSPNIPDSKRAAYVRNKIWPGLKKEIVTYGYNEEQPVFIRIIKDSSILQLWRFSGNQYKLFKTYPICFFSGGLGTKKKEWDGKAPEGFYTIKPDQLNPYSSYHLAMNIGYPNELERQLHYTGNAIMIHGDCLSAGCYAMTDDFIDEIYTMVYMAFMHGQKAIDVNIFPFKMDNAHMKAHANSRSYPFWQNLKIGYDMFERTHLPPAVTVVNKAYAFELVRGQ
jgi:murein L,D-transpeptidase YafK